MASNADAVVEPAELGSRGSAAPVELFIIHAADAAAFVRGYLLPEANLPRSQVKLFDEPGLGEQAISGLVHGVSDSRFTVVVVSDAYLGDPWAVLARQQFLGLAGSCSGS